jgi:hypothetical protein
MQMVISSIKSTVLVVFGEQYGFVGSKNKLQFPRIHLYSILIFKNIFGVFWTFLELVEAVDARIVSSQPVAVNDSPNPASTSLIVFTCRAAGSAPPPTC